MSTAPDFVVRAPNEGLVLAVEARNRPNASPEWAAEMRHDLAVRGFLPDAPFFLLALRDHFFLWKQPPLLQLVPPDYQAPTREVLRPYLENLRTPLHEFSKVGFEAVVGLWLDDLVHGTLNGGSEWLTDSGLRECARNATVVMPAGV
ncbi:MAG TPA: hypothetical protein VF647_03705 [Longimicrobium sp.]|jgi:hypothetical protein